METFCLSYPLNFSPFGGGGVEAARKKYVRCKALRTALDAVRPSRAWRNILTGKQKQASTPCHGFMRKTSTAVRSLSPLFPSSSPETKPAFRAPAYLELVWRRFCQQRKGLPFSVPSLVWKRHLVENATKAKRRPNTTDNKYNSTALLDSQAASFACQPSSMVCSTKVLRGISSIQWLYIL